MTADGSTAIVGDYRDEEPQGTGSAYVFEEVNGGWQQVTKLVAADGDQTDVFGLVSTAADGSTAVIGAPVKKASNDTGSAYVFERGEGELSASFTVSPENPTVGEEVEFDASGSTDPDGTIFTFE